MSSTIHSHWCPAGWTWNLPAHRWTWRWYLCGRALQHQEPWAWSLMRFSNLFRWILARLADLCWLELISSPHRSYSSSILSLALYTPSCVNCFLRDAAWKPVDQQNTWGHERTCLRGDALLQRGNTCKRLFKGVRGHTCHFEKVFPKLFPPSLVQP